MRRTWYQGSALAAVTLLFSGCSQPDVDAYAGTRPEITIRSFYSAPIEGYGFLQDRSGKVTDRYYATLIPAWNGNDGTITEKQWNDKGELFFQQTWSIHLAEDKHDYTGTATRIDGPITGRSSGSAMHMTYVLLSPAGKGDDVKLSADDWTYLQPDGMGINKVALSKYGFHVGDVTYDLHKVPKGETLHEGYFP